MPIHHFTNAEIKDDINRIEIILGTRIFTRTNSEHPLFKSAFIELMICLNDLLQKAKDFKVPVTFTDDIVFTGKVENITDTISMVRNALCHTPSKQHILGDNFQLKATFNVNWGKTGMNINGVFIGSDYADDVSFHFGKHKIYLYRHIYRALEEVKINLAYLIVFASFPELVGLQITELAALSLPLNGQYDRYQ